MRTNIVNFHGADSFPQLSERVAVGVHASLWPELRKLWRDLARTQLTFWDVEDEEKDQSSKKDEDLRTICGSLAKFTRNLVAGVTENQARA